MVGFVYRQSTFVFYLSMVFHLSLYMCVPYLSGSKKRPPSQPEDIDCADRKWLNANMFG